MRGRAAFNPNEPKQYRPEEWRNRAVTDLFEPGSIFKAVTAAAALEEKVSIPRSGSIAAREASRLPTA
jgi:stage V sporulation protein D (sporulation-specific penicillin-binding protein)